MQPIFSNFCSQQQARQLGQVPRVKLEKMDVQEGEADH